MMDGRLDSFHGRCALLALLLLPLLLTAQSEKAQLTGNITDPSGALVPGVQVTVTNVATDEKRSTTSTETGLYTVPLLEPGKYEITVKKEGFHSLTR